MLARQATLRDDMPARFFDLRLLESFASGDYLKCGRSRVKLERSGEPG